MTMKLTGVDEEGPSGSQNQILELLNSSLKKRERTPYPSSHVRTGRLWSREPRTVQAFPALDYCSCPDSSKGTSWPLGNHVSLREQSHHPLSPIPTAESGYAFFSGRPEVLFRDLHFSPPPARIRKENKTHQEIAYPFFTVDFLPSKSHRQTRRVDGHILDRQLLDNSKQ